MDLNKNMENGNNLNNMANEANSMANNVGQTIENTLNNATSKFTDTVNKMASELGGAMEQTFSGDNTVNQQNYNSNMNNQQNMNQNYNQNMNQGYNQQNMNMQGDRVTPQDKNVSAPIAALLSVLLVGLGQLVNGQVLKGIIMFIGCIAINMVVGFITCGVGAFITGPICWVISALDAYKCTRILENGGTLGKYEFHIIN